MSPAKRWAATTTLVAKFEVSQRRGCRVLGSFDPASDDHCRIYVQLVTCCVLGCGRSPRLALVSDTGDCLRCCGPRITRSATSGPRLCREGGLRVRGNTRKRWRVISSTVPADRLVAIAVNQVCDIDYQVRHDQRRAIVETVQRHRRVHP